MEPLSASKLSLDTAVLLIEQEAWRNEFYADEGGYPTIGAGHKLTASELSSGKLYINDVKRYWRNGLTNIDVLRLFHQDVASREDVINDLVRVPLNQDQFDALLMFVYNIGRTAFRHSTLLRLLNQNDHALVPDQMHRWTYVNGKVSQGLVRRRAAEAALWEGQPHA